ncbi:MAG: hypothetical protein PWQ70_2188 [Clostridiales bacterium]|nr:hypothetical protein [Clostridiales bacterium]
MFYNKKIEILDFQEGYTDDYGIYHKGQEIVLKSIQCDVQPISADLVQKIFGNYKNINYRIFADVDESLDTGVIIQYDNQKYKIKKIILWDEYVDFIVEKV